MMRQSFSWGNYPHKPQRLQKLASLDTDLPQHSFLPYGMGRSYGDSCLNSEGVLLSSAALKRFISFDSASGILKMEAGVSLADILALVVPHGWFLPVSPGSKFVTVAGAIANDVHGKNHHSAASFGNHVLQFELCRSDGRRLLCSESENTEFFYATIGGLGLTGFISWAEIQLKPITSMMIDVESIKYRNLDEFFVLAKESAESFEYTAVWLDASAKGSDLGRGHFLRGNHVEETNDLSSKALSVFPQKRHTVPFTPPLSLVNGLSVKLFNQLYYARQRAIKKQFTQHFDPFFYPLDSILQWNRIYGRAGFLQYQCIVPTAQAEAAMRELLQTIADSGSGSFLVVLKTMGDIASKGLLSFSRPGANLAIDFPFQGKKTLTLLSRLDQIVKSAGGALYPAKDARMSAELFQQAYPQWQQLEQLRDANITSDFWQRVTKG